MNHILAVVWGGLWGFALCNMAVRKDYSLGFLGALCAVGFFIMWLKETLK